MPSWCSNTMYVEDKEFIDKLVRHRNDIGFGLLETFLPTPPPLKHVERAEGMANGGIVIQYLHEGTEVPLAEQEIKAHKDLYGSVDWSDWQQQNWGTHLDAEKLVIELVSDSEAVLRFDTAWSPPVEWLRRITQGYGGKFLLVYAEGGFGFWGLARFDEGLEVECWEEGDFWSGQEADDGSQIPSPQVQAFTDKYGLHTGR